MEEKKCPHNGECIGEKYICEHMYSLDAETLGCDLDTQKKEGESNESR